MSCKTTLPVLIPLPVIDSISFDEYKASIKDGKLPGVNRKHEVQEAYNKLKKESALIWVSMSDRMLHNLFEIKFRTNKEGLRYISPEDVKNIKGKCCVKVTENNFSYNFTDKVVHFNIWKINEPITLNDVTSCAKILMKKHNAIDVLYWENPPNRKSVKRLPHVHIVLKLPSSTAK